MEETPRRQYQNYRSNASANWRLKDDSPRQSPPQRFNQRNDQNNNSESANGTRLYVGNLLYTAQPKDVEELFINNAFNVAQINMSTDPFTGRNPSYCFVDLNTPEEAQRAMDELNGKDVLGRAVRINPGHAKRGPTGGSQTRTRNYDQERPNDSSPVNGNNRSGFDRNFRGDASNNIQTAIQQGRRVYVGGLPPFDPPEIVDSEMRNLFEGFGVQSVSKLISPHPSKAAEPGSHHYLFVDLTSSDEVEFAIEKFNGMESPWGGELRVNKAKDNRERKPNRDYQSNSQSRWTEPSNWRQ